MGVIVELNIKNRIEYMTSVKQNWLKVDKNTVIDKSNTISWDYGCPLNVQNMWDEIHTKLLSFSDCVPSSKLKTTKRGEVLSRLPWDSSKLVRKRKEKDQAWKAFDERPIMTVFQTALHKENEYSKVEFQEKLKYEQKLVQKLKTNSKPFFKYLRSKNKLKKTVSELENPSGILTKTPLETAETLANFFQSVFKSEEYGPLTKESYESQKFIIGIMEKLVIMPDMVKKNCLQI